MFCPKCGKGEQKPEGFCRDCGQYLPDLNKTSKQVFFGATTAESIKISLNLSIASAVMCLILAVCLLAEFFGKTDTSVIVYFVIGFLLSMTGWQASNVYIAVKLRRKFNRGRGDAGLFDLKADLKSSPAQNALQAADTARIVRPEPISVTENATELLEPALPERER